MFDTSEFDTVYSKYIWKRDQKPTRHHKLMEHIINHINGKRTIRDEYNLIKTNKSTLSRIHREFVINIMENEHVEKI